jgi:hypothetical protein
MLWLQPGSFDLVASIVNELAEQLHKSVFFNGTVYFWVERQYFLSLWIWGCWGFLACGFTLNSNVFLMYLSESLSRNGQFLI